MELTLIFNRSLAVAPELRALLGPFDRYPFGDRTVNFAAVQNLLYTAETLDLDRTAMSSPGKTSLTLPSTVCAYNTKICINMYVCYVL